MYCEEMMGSQQIARILNTRASTVCLVLRKAGVPRRSLAEAARLRLPVWTGPDRTTHGHAPHGAFTPTYWTWQGMHARCRYPSSSGYKHYGGRGITVCDRWASFENFLADMGERPKGTSIDRINVDGNYEPGNCRWATPKEQRQNRRAKEAK